MVVEARPDDGRIASCLAVQRPPARVWWGNDRDGLWPPPDDLVGHLDPGGILVSWTARGFPVSPGQDLLATFEGARTTVAGHAGKLSIKRSAPDAFRPQIGSRESMVLDVLRDTPDNRFEMIACIRAPGIAAHEAEVRSMLESTRFIANWTARERGDLRVRRDRTDGRIVTGPRHRPPYTGTADGHVTQG